jgi:hypothetical protein
MNEHRGLVLHIAEGFYEGTIAWQQGDNSVSSHFVVGREHGESAQLVDTDVTAWTQRDGNGEWLSAEFAGFTPSHPLHRKHPGWEKLSEWQLDTAARLLVKAHALYHVPLQIASSAGGRGLGHHSMGGESWGHRDCPGPAIIGQKGEILRRARALAGEAPVRPRPELNRGDKGAAVRELQDRCNKVPSTGNDVAEDGDFGPATDAKVRRVQKHFGLVVDGVAGRKTWGKLGVSW